MIKIKFNIRTLIDKRDNRVIVRVRWNQKTNEVGFTTGMYAQEDKWDFLNQKAIKGTVHVINGNKFNSHDINDRICEFQEEIRKVFSIYEMNNTVPTPSELKMMVNRELGRIEDSTQVESPKKTSLKILLNRFLKECGNEKNWDDDCKEKYTQAYQHITAAVPSVTPYNITIDTMYKLRDWYVKNEYKQEKITNAELALLPKNDNVYVVDESNEQNDNIFIEHLIIISTSKKAIAYKVAEIIDENNKKIENLTNLCHKAKQKSETMKLSASMRFNVAKYEEEEKEYTKEEIACMAL
jgi:hypothetical protein